MEATMIQENREQAAVMIAQIQGAKRAILLIEGMGEAFCEIFDTPSANTALHQIAGEGFDYSIKAELGKIEIEKSLKYASGIVAGMEFCGKPKTSPEIQAVEEYSRTITSAWVLISEQMAKK